MAQPTQRHQAAEISFKVDGESDPNQSKANHCTCNLEEEAWIGPADRPENPGLVVYAMADGAFAVWDPARHAWTCKDAVDTPE